MTTPFLGQTMIVTGASGAIGAAISRALAGAGAQVWGLARDEHRLAAALSGIAAPDGSAARWRATDLTRTDSVQDAIEGIHAESGRIDLLFNNAGRFNSIAGVHECDVDDWWMDVTVNLKGLLAACRVTLPLMLEQGFGTIVNMNGGRPIGGTAYAASKAGVVQLTQLMAKELTHMHRDDIRVLGANPGLVPSEMTERQRDSEAGQYWIPNVGQMMREGRTRAPEEIATRTVEMLQTASPKDNGREFNPDGWID